MPSWSQQINHWSWWSGFLEKQYSPIWQLYHWNRYHIWQLTTQPPSTRSKRSKQGKRSKSVRFLGRKYHAQVAAKPAMSSVIFAAKKDILEKFVSPLTPRRKKYPVAHENFTKDQNEYPSTMVTIRINRQKHTIKVDWGAEANIILAKTYQELYSKPVLQPSKAKTQTLCFTAVSTHGTIHSEHLCQREADHNHHICY